MIRLLNRFAKVLPDRCYCGYTRHSLLDKLKQRVFQIACACEDANDAGRLRKGPA